jgi:serine/threonine protein phosphatase 1
MKRTIIVGDVHGCLEELKALMATVKISVTDRLIFTGDLLDKGPDSVGVVRFVRWLEEEGIEVILVLGNHEEKHSRFRKAYAKAGEKGIKKFKGKAELLSITQGLSAEDVDFLETAVPFFRLPEMDVLVVHGGVLPYWEELDASDRGMLSKMLRVRHVTGKAVAKVTVEYVVEGPAAESQDLDVDDIHRLAVEDQELRRQVKPKGAFITLGQEASDDPFWANVYEGQLGHVYFGHSPYPEEEVPVLFRHATALDLGCVFGGRLACVVLEDDEADTVVTVGALEKYATSFWEE